MSRFNGPAANIEDNRKKVSDFSKKTGPESYPSVEAVEKYFLAKQNGVVKVWQPNTPYNVDDYCYASYLNTETNLYENRVIKCTVSHTSSDYLADDLDKWSAPPMVVNIAARDLLQRYIHDTYATKEELENIVIPEVERSVANTIRMWQPNTEYKIGDYVYSDAIGYGGATIDVICKCNETHTSKDSVYADGKWSIYGIYASNSINDSNGNPIHETYATKEEVVGTLGTINEVLATLVEVE